MEVDQEWVALRESRHAELVLVRMHALLKAGYQLDPAYQWDGCNVVGFKHPAKTTQALVLYGDGWIIGSSLSRSGQPVKEERIDPANEQDFRVLLGKTPKLTPLQTLANVRFGDAATQIVVWAVLIGMGLLLTTCWNAVFARH